MKNIKRHKENKIPYNSTIINTFLYLFHKKITEIFGVYISIYMSDLEYVYTIYLKISIEKYIHILILIYSNINIIYLLLKRCVTHFNVSHILYTVLPRCVTHSFRNFAYMNSFNTPGNSMVGATGFIPIFSLGHLSTGM